MGVPVGLLFSRTYCFGICVDCNFNLHQHKEVPVGILHTPIQFVRTLVRSMTNRARYNAAIPNRSELQGSRELDFDVLRKAVNKQEDKNSVRILRHHLSLAGWTSTKLASIDRLDGDDVCICGAQCPTKLHIIRDCKHPALVRARGEAFPDHEKLFKLKLPDLFHLGLPETLTNNPEFLTYGQDGEPIYCQALADIWSPNSS